MADEAARPVILWFRRDLKLDDNPALNAAVATERPLSPLFILDETEEALALRAASRWRLDNWPRAQRRLPR